MMGKVSLQPICRVVSVVLTIACCCGIVRADDLCTGRITDKDSGEPLFGVSVYLIGNRTGGVTDESGRFSLKVKAAGTDTLRVRRIDYVEVVRQVTVPGTYDIVLEPEYHVLETVEVHAKRADELPIHERTSASVNVVTKEDIPERAALIDEVLDSSVGVDIRSLGGTGAKSEISIRGSTTDQVAVYVDGVPIGAGGSGVSGLSFVPLSQVDRIEVYRGSAPGAFGAGAIGGVVNISTDSDKDENGVGASLSYGSFATTHQNMTANFNNDHGRFQLSAGRNASDNDFRFYDDRGTTIDTSDDGWETRRNSDYESLNMLARWDSESVRGNEFMVKIATTDTERGVAGLGRRPALNARLKSKGFLGQVRHSYKNLIDTRIWALRENRGFYDPADEAGRRGRQDSDDDITVNGINTQLTKLFGVTILHVNAELKHEKFEASDSYDSAVIAPSKRLSIGAGAEAEIMLFDGDLWICPRVHMLGVDDKLIDTGTFLANSPVVTTIEADRNVTTLALGVRYRAAESLVFRMNGGVYPRLPEFNELFGDTGDIVGNTKLDEERSVNIDAGVHYDMPSGAFTFDTSVFYRDAEDLIQRRNYGDYLISENIGKAEIAGVESWTGYRLLNGRLSGRVSVAYQDAINRSDETVFRKQRYYGKILPYRPEWKGALTTGVQLHEKARLTWKADYESECYKGPSNLTDEKLESRTIHSLALHLGLHDRVDTVFEIDNVGDNHAPDRWGYPKPGRGYFLTLAWRWERDRMSE